MKYISIDIETTGLDENENQMIEFGAIIEDTNNPKSYEDSKKYRRILLARDGKYVFNSYAAKLNSSLIELISDIENGKNINLENTPNLTQVPIYSDELIGDFKTWLLFNDFTENEKGVLEVVVAGKNFSGFDRKFIEYFSDFKSYGLRFHLRTIDPSISYIDWKNDKVPPSLALCKKRAGLKDEVAHQALADAWDIILLLRKEYTETSSV